MAVAWGGNTSTLNAHFGTKQGLEDQHALHGAPLFVPHPITLTERGRDGESSLEWRQDGTSNAVLTPGGGRGGMGVGAVCATGEVFHTLRADGFDASEDGTGRGGGAIAFHANAQADQLPSASRDTSVSDALTCSQSAAVAFQQNTRDEVRLMNGDGAIAGALAGALAASPGTKQQKYVTATAMQVRRLTPTECERLQGFPDGYTAITYRGKLAADGPRYKALGNSMAVPVMAWIGRQIDIAESGLA